jgi:SAM-dependent methyltransferase
MSTLKTQEHWDEKHISTFWDWVSGSPYWQSKYFTKQVGLGIKNFLNLKVNLKGSYLDYGCGSGHFLELMVKNPQLKCFGLEYSPNSRDLVSDKLKNQENWGRCEILTGFPSLYEENQFDTITFIETIEHLKDDMLNDTIKELYRLLKPGGRLVITTPYNETLANNHVYCPFCDSEFHRMQHMRKFTINSMNELLEKYGFGVQFCDHVNFSKWDSFSNMRRYYIQSFLQTLKLTRYQNGNKPHLVGIFTKQ